MWGIVIVCSATGALSMEGRSFRAGSEVDGGLFSGSEEESGRCEGEV